jgi:hypothetical protein
MPFLSVRMLLTTILNQLPGIYKNLLQNLIAALSAAFPGRPLLLTSGPPRYMMNSVNKYNLFTEQSGNIGRAISISVWVGSARPTG